MLLRALVGVTSALLVVALGPCVASGASGTPRRVVTVPASIAADCSTDVSAPLQRWLRRIPDGSLALLERRGCYRVETEMVVRGKDGVTIDGRGALLRRTVYTPPERRYPNANAVLRLVHFTDSTLTRLRIRGTNTKPDLPYLPPVAGSWRPEVEFDHGLALHGFVRSTVQNVRIRSVWGDGIYLAGGDQWTPAWSSHVVLSDVTIEQNGRQGIAINRSRHVLVDRATIVFSRRAAIDLEPDTAGETISDVEIRNSDLWSNLVAISAFGAGRVDHVSVHHNRIHRTATPWVYVRSSLGLDRHDWSVRENVVSETLGSTQPALAFWNTRGIVVSGNRVSLSTSQSQKAVGLWDGSRRATIRCNLFLGAATRFVAGRESAATLEANRLTPAPRRCGPVLRTELDAPLPTVWVGDVAPLVRYIERRLGLPTADVTFDQGTQHAIGLLQAQHGVPATGVVDDATWKLVLSLPR